MDRDLKARLRRYQANKKLREEEEPEYSKINNPCQKTDGASSWSGWTEAGFNVLKREISIELKIPGLKNPGLLPAGFPRALAILVPDILRTGRNSFPSPGEFLFFDLETTGLSGGAGTVAFLAAFGRFNVAANGGVSRKTRLVKARLVITQYLLLDYPGESDFIEMAVKEFTASPHSLVVSYNGKSFDSQILRNRCLMNGITPPLYFHADLLHPARRLWKTVLSDCSQSTIETNVLGLDRSGDVSGAMAPEIWFSFLKSGENSGLLSVCEHNVKDITGLAALFLALTGIAAEPFDSLKRFRFDDKALALFWWKALKRNPHLFVDDEKKTGEALLLNAARNGCAAAAIEMAKDAEWRLKDYRRALDYTDMALAANGISEGLRSALEKRRIRLEKKVKSVLTSET